MSTTVSMPSNSSEVKRSAGGTVVDVAVDLISSARVRRFLTAEIKAHIYWDGVRSDYNSQGPSSVSWLLRKENCHQQQGDRK